jgi:hypothetical protein
MKTAIRWAVIVSGYLFAVVAGAVVFWVRGRMHDPADVAASSGMYAFGDSLVFLAAVAVFSVPSMFLLFREVAKLQGLWKVLAWLCLSWALTAPLGALVFAHNTGGASSLLSVTRTFAAPFCFGLALLACVASPKGLTRWLYLAAAALETAPMVVFWTTLIARR